MPDFQLMDQTRTYRSLLSLALGKPLVVLCLPDTANGVARALLRACAEGRLAAGASVIAISGQSVEDNARFSDDTGLPFPLLADPEHWVTSLYDVRHRALQGEERQPGGSVACVVADANRRILAMCHQVPEPGRLEALLGCLDSLPQEPAREVGRQAPVLIVPGVLEPDFCGRLIALYDAGRQELTGVSRGDHRDRPHVVDRESKVRRDHIVADQATNAEIRARLTKRVIPELAKAFDFQPKQGERFKIGCYEWTESGFFEAHRDNVDPVGGRRFAMSLNLNTGEFEGGAIRFPEYGPHLYRPAAGEAVVFSCRLVHEVTPVTAGRRLVLLTFFHG